jgi:hypothetical protein
VGVAEQNKNAQNKTDRRRAEKAEEFFFLL